MTRAYGLFSGGLDSLLASRLLLDQGIEVVAVTFVSPFFGAAKARGSASQLPVEHRVIDITEALLPVVEQPRYGHGSTMNPCIDCHALMFREAGRLMTAEGGDFLFSGEVLGQRPMSQNRQSLWVVERDSGFAGRVLRPLSAQRLKPTLPEETGLVDRARLLGLTGRGRKPQIALAVKYGLRYPAPAGGCLLTDPIYSRRLRDLIDRGGLADRSQVRLLALGRHLRLSSGAKLVVGRSAKENSVISAEAAGGILLAPAAEDGPLALLPPDAGPGDVLEAAGVVARYVAAAPAATVPVAVMQAGRRSVLDVAAADPAWIEARFV